MVYYLLVYVVGVYFLNFALLRLIVKLDAENVNWEGDKIFYGWLIILSPISIYVELWIIGYLIYDNGLICKFIKKYFSVLDKYIGKLGRWIMGGQK